MTTTLGFFDFLKKKTPEEKALIRKQKAEVKAAYDEAYRQAEIDGARRRGATEGALAGEKGKGKDGDSSYSR